MTAYTDSEKYRQDVRNAVSWYNSKLEMFYPTPFSIPRKSSHS